MLHFATLLHERVSTKAAVHTVGSMFMPSEPCRLPWLHVRTVHQRLRSNTLLLNQLERVASIIFHP